MNGFTILNSTSYVLDNGETLSVVSTTTQNNNSLGIILGCTIGGAILLIGIFAVVWRKWIRK